MAQSNPGAKFRANNNNESIISSASGVTSVSGYNSASGVSSITSASGTSVSGTSVSGTSVSGTRSEGTSASGTRSEGTSASGTSVSGITTGTSITSGETTNNQNLEGFEPMENMYELTTLTATISELNAKLIELDIENKLKNTPELINELYLSNPIVQGIVKNIKNQIDNAILIGISPSRLLQIINEPMLLKNEKHQHVIFDNLFSYIFNIRNKNENRTEGPYLNLNKGNDIHRGIRDREFSLRQEISQGKGQKQIKGTFSSVPVNHSSLAREVINTGISSPVVNNLTKSAIKGNGIGSVAAEPLIIGSNGAGRDDNPNLSRIETQLSHYEYITEQNANNIIAIHSRVIKIFDNSTNKSSNLTNYNDKTYDECLNLADEILSSQMENVAYCEIVKEKYKQLNENITKIIESIESNYIFIKEKILAIATLIHNKGNKEVYNIELDKYKDEFLNQKKDEIKARLLREVPMLRGGSKSKIKSKSKKNKIKFKKINLTMKKEFYNKSKKCKH